MTQAVEIYYNGIGYVYSRQQNTPPAIPENKRTPAGILNTKPARASSEAIVCVMAQRMLLHPAFRFLARYALLQSFCKFQERRCLEAT